MNGFRIYKTTDKIEVRIDGISFYVSPLSYQQKCELQPFMMKAASGDMQAAMDAVKLSFKLALKGVKGIKTEDDEGCEVDYKFDFDENGQVTDDCIDDILNMPINQKLSSLCTSLMSGLSSRICGMDGQPIPGIEVVGKISEAKK